MEGRGGQQQKDHCFHYEVRTCPSTSSRDPGHLPGVPEEALQQHDQEAANASQVQVRNVQVIIYDKKTLKINAQTVKYVIFSLIFRGLRIILFSDQFSISVSDFKIEISTSLSVLKQNFFFLWVYTVQCICTGPKHRTIRDPK